MIIKCRFGNPDCDKSLFTCNDCQVILDFIEECKGSGADTRLITWLGQAVGLLEQVVNVNVSYRSALVTKTEPITRP